MKIFTNDIERAL